MGGKVNSELLLFRKTWPMIYDDASAEVIRDLTSLVRAFRIYDDDLISEIHRADRVTDVLFFVKGYQHGGYLHEEIVGKSESGLKAKSEKVRSRTLSLFLYFTPDCYFLSVGESTSMLFIWKVVDVARCRSAMALL